MSLTIRPAESLGHCEDLARIAKALEGIGPADYAALIATGETESRQREMCRMSGCALVAAAVWRLAGVQHELLDPPYRTGTAVSRLLRIAQECDGWHDRPTELPVRGDTILIGTGQTEHVCIVQAASENRIWTTDGGQGPCSIVARERAITRTGSRWIVGGRVLVGIAPGALLPAFAKTQMPVLG